MSSIRVRHSLQHVQYLYTSGADRSKLENLIRAYRGVQALPPDDPNSFFLIGGLHGLPFRGPGETDPTWWGGYCWHSTVLFPTWHRAYLLRMEDALRSIPGCQDVTIPYWDELANPNPKPGELIIPSVLTSPTFELDGRNDNPLYSYKLQAALVNSVGGNRSSKPKGYDTVRYPLSGLMGTEEDRKQTEVHNAAYTNYAQNAHILNDNVAQWLLGTVNIPDDPEGSRRPDTYSVHSRFLRSLFAPNYTVFSNTASGSRWIKEHKDDSTRYVVSLESPHNAIHLALGGFYQAGVYNASPIRGANGDMGDNDTAGFDPIFHFHHCFVDYVFSIWQRFWGFTKRGSLDVIPDYDGTILQDGQPPNFPPGTHIDMNTPLYPFQMPSGEYYNSYDMTDMNELGISYGPGSLDPIILAINPASPKSPLDILNSTFDDTPTLADSPLPITKYGFDPITLAGSDPNADNPFPVIKWVHNISRVQFHGSFVVRLYAEGHDGSEVEVGREAILSRWDVKGCRNCQNHLDVDLYVPMDATALKFLRGPGNATIKWRVGIQTHELPHHTEDPDGGEGGLEPEIDDL